MGSGSHREVACFPARDRSKNDRFQPHACSPAACALAVNPTNVAAARAAEPASKKLRRDGFFTSSLSFSLSIIGFLSYFLIRRLTPWASSQRSRGIHMEFAVVTPRSRCSHRVHSRVFGRRIQESEFTQIRMPRPLWRPHRSVKVGVSLHRWQSRGRRKEVGPLGGVGVPL